MFPGATRFGIDGGQFTNVQGNVNIQQPMISYPADIITSGPREASQVITSNQVAVYSESGNYCSQLLRQGRGFPLYVPGPQVNLPGEYRRRGVAIGDVGRVTTEGCFDFFFNIYLPANHPINANIPEDFVPLSPYRPIDVYHYHFDPGNYVSSPSVSGINGDFPGFPGGEFVFNCSGPNGALLALPHGAHLKKLENLESMRQYAAKHAESWYKYVNGERGRGLVNGNLYLVTGCEKAKSWGMASFHNAAFHNEFQLSFRPTTDADSDYRYRWQGGHCRRKQADSTPDGTPLNQTTFIHAFAISVSEGIWEKLFGVEVCQLVDSSTFLDKSGRSFVPFGSQGSSFLSFFFGSNGYTGGRQHTGQTPHDGLVTDAFPTPKIVHPSQIIHERIFREAPQARVVITHDDDWRDVFKDDGTGTAGQNPSELQQAIFDRFQIMEENGVMFLGDRAHAIVSTTVEQRHRDCGHANALPAPSHQPEPTSPVRPASTLSSSSRTLSGSSITLAGSLRTQFSTTALARILAEGAPVLQFARNTNDDINAAASYRYFQNLEEDMARSRRAREGENALAMSSSAAAVDITRNPGEEMMFQLDTDEGQETAEGAITTLVDQPAKPPRPSQPRRTSARTPPTDTGLPQSFSGLRPASLPFPPHAVPLRREASVESLSEEEEQELLDEELDTRDQEIRRLVAAEMPSHRQAWKKGSVEWRTLVSPHSNTGDKDFASDDGSVLEEEGGDGVEPAGAAATTSPSANADETLRSRRRRTLRIHQARSDLPALAKSHTIVPSDGATMTAQESRRAYGGNTTHDESSLPTPSNNDSLALNADVPWTAADPQHNIAPPFVAPPPYRSITTAPVGFSYNLPAPVLPSTPHTTRQQMLRNEMSESVRQNLLWQRKLSRTDTIGPRKIRGKELDSDPPKPPLVSSSSTLPPLASSSPDAPHPRLPTPDQSDSEDDAMVSPSSTPPPLASSDSEDDARMWQKMPTSERHKSVLPAWGGRPALPVRTDSNKLGKPVQRRPGKPSPSTPLEAYSLRKQTGSAAREGETWAPRPPPEDVYDRLQDFFPELDLDKPATEMISEGTGGTVDKTLAPVPSSTSAPPDTKRVRGKSIRSVVARAVERKKIIDRTSRAEGHTMVQQKSTKLWGSKLEEMDTSNLSEPSSTSEGATTFKWVRGELIGRGTYGRVYLALNATTGDMIAVKQIEIPRTASDNNDSRKVTVVQALKLESETLKLLDHPNIVQYLGFEETPTNLSIFMEYVPGGSIGSCVLEYGRFDEDVTKSFTSQILDGLAYLHSKGIVHRDLKSDSILVEMTGVCKISEFGISKRTDRQNDAAMSSVFWMAPELINPQKKGDSFKIDIWSIGCVALEMWAGTRPWLGDEVVAVMFKLFQAKLPPPVPDGLVLTPLADDFRKSCFAINPDERPSAAVLRHHPYLTISPGWQFDSFATKPSSVM